MARHTRDKDRNEFIHQQKEQKERWREFPAMEERLGWSIPETKRSEKTEREREKQNGVR